MRLRQQQLHIQVLFTSVILLCLFFPVDVTHAFFGIGDYVKNFFYGVITAFGSFLLWIGSSALDTSIYYLIVSMGSWFGGEGQFGSAVSLAWSIIRDLLNMFFIFGLIYIGIKTILNSEDSGTRRALGYLIAAALLINFSLFITQTVVDFTNLIATEVYKQIVVDPVRAKEEATIAQSFFTAAGLSSFYDPKGVAVLDNLGVGEFLFFSFVMLVFFSIAGIILLMGSVLIITRFVALVLYMVFSPLMFMGWILPSFSSWATKWWTGFFKYAFFGPAYMFMLYLSLVMFEKFMGMISGQTNASFAGSFAAKQNPGEMASFSVMTMTFAIMIGFLYASLKIGDKMSIAGGSFLANTMQANASGFIYRNTVGRGMNRAIKGLDYIDRKTGGLASPLLGGEAARRTLVKARNYNAGGGYSLEEAQSMRAEAASRRRTLSRADNLKKEVRSGNLDNLSDREIVDYLKDPKKSKLIKGSAGKLSPSALKAIGGDKDIDAATVAKLKEDHKKAVKARIKDGGFAEIAKQFKNDAKEIAIAGGKELNNDEVAAYLAENMGMIDELGKHLDTGTQKELKTKILRAAEKKGLTNEVTSKLSKSRNWTV